MTERRFNMWELVVVWTSDGSKDIHTYSDRESAEKKLKDYEWQYAE